MKKNRIKEIWNRGEAVLNGWLSISSPFMAEIMAEQGYDSLCVDIQHGLVDYGGAVSMFQAMRASNVVALARVPWLEAGIIMKMLDAGAYGIICPMINTAEQAAALVDALRYPPDGNRSFGPTRANISAGPGYASEANNQILALAMIETKEAVSNVESIVATPGLNGIYIGPADLTLSVTAGRLSPGFDREEPEMLEVIHHILKVTKAAGLRAGLHCGTPEYAAKAVGWGFDLVTISNDVRLLATAAQASVSKARTLLS